MTAVKGGILNRALRNAGLLLSGKAAAGVMQLATFAIAARALGLAEFGALSIVLAQIQLLIGIATFQSNQAVIRYGVAHIEANDRAAFQRLVKVGTLFDLAAALAAATAAVLLAPVIGRWAGWDGRLVLAAQIIAPLAFANAIATPKGMLRLFGRFDLLARHVTITPAARLIGTIVAAALGATLFGFVAVWLVSGLIGAAVALLFGWREAARRGLLAGLGPSLRNLTAGNAGIWGFSAIANLHSTLAMIPGHLSTFAVGVVLGPAPAGLMKVAQEVGTGLAKPIDLLNQTVYPDLARLAAEGRWRRLRRLVLKSGVIAAAVSAAITVLLALFGEYVVGAIFGASYRAAHHVLLLISLATTVSVSAFAVIPALYAAGRATGPLFIALGANLLFVAVLLGLLPSEQLFAAGLAYVAAAIATVLLSAYWMRSAIPAGAVEKAS
ncbi:lipopolysaccharide biosynthesis protein [Sphingomonas sp.]|uniref:lipopolysaccharide biosynthesis protein n=1 Tax=Sphingomonas sp. TaxID=28214 RepID=UPI00286DB3DE|nr:lipopolysaccharide biosynthesis protein [Sphingomonas sp.]